MIRRSYEHPGSGGSTLYANTPHRSNRGTRCRPHQVDSKHPSWKNATLCKLGSMSHWTEPLPTYDRRYTTRLPSGNYYKVKKVQKNLYTGMHADTL